jgi:hypothetical protein
LGELQFINSGINLENYIALSTRMESSYATRMLKLTQWFGLAPPNAPTDYNIDRLILLHKDEITHYQALSRIPTESDFLSVTLHGGTEGSFLIGKTEVSSAETLANIIQSSEKFTGQAIKLESCYSGMQPFGQAQNLSNLLGVPVKAPNNILYARPSGFWIPGKTLMEK